jgi:alanine racemase
MKKLFRCWAEIDLDALRGNLAALRHRVGPRVKVLTVVKADAYGHGLKQIAAVLMQSGTDVFGVANLAEAQAIRGVGRGWPILMLGACLPEEMERAVHDEVRPTISTPEEAIAFAETARRLARPAAVHVKVDTGMSRLGVQPADALALVQTIQSLPGLRLEGIYTHYASAEDDAASAARQARTFRRVLASLKKAGITVPLVHANNSAGVLHQPRTNFDLVRPGLLVYGVIPPGRRVSTMADLPFLQNLRPALSFKSRVTLVKSIRPGTRLSYGGTFLSRRPMRIATVAAGYGDGYFRAAGRRARVLLHGQRCPIVGRITMDQMLVDITAVPGVAAGDEVVLIGRQSDAVLSASEVARWAGTIPWEILTNITYRVPRVYRGGQAS